MNHALPTLLSRVTRPFLRKRTPLMRDICKLAMGLLCPKGSWPPGDVIIAPVEGGIMALDLGSSLEYMTFFRGCHEPEIQRLIRTVVSPGDTCLDIGANVGSHTLVMAKQVGSAGRVLALEPHPELVERLQRNICLNELSQVEVIQAAVSNQEGTVKFYGFSPGAVQQSTSSLLPDEEASRQLEVPSITGRSLEQNSDLSRCNFVKIDVEGAEAIVLDEFAGVIERSRPCLIFEYRKKRWDRFEKDLGTTLGWLHGLTYELFFVYRHTTHRLIDTVPPRCDIVCIPKSNPSLGAVIISKRAQRKLAA